MSLGRPLRQDELAVVKFKYTPNGRAANMLPLNVGDEVVILSRDSEAQGWWKGRIGDRVSVCTSLCPTPEYTALIRTRP